MNIREAILKAADHIERNKTSLSFMSTQRPSIDGQGCPLAWIGFFAGIERREGDHPSPYLYAHSTVAPLITGLYWEEAQKEFFDRMNALRGSAGWTCDPRGAAKTLRAYADKYHPADFPPIPDRRFDWRAVTDNYDGAPDSHCPVGYGRTEQEAIDDLKQQLEEA